MLKIRLSRFGKKKQPIYRIVVTPQTAPVQGQYIESIGHFDPRRQIIVLDKEKAKEWLSKGAQPSNTVAKILQKEGLKHKLIVIKKFKAVSKAELERQKAEEEAERAKKEAEKEAAKEAWEQKAEEIAEQKQEPSKESPSAKSADETGRSASSDDKDKSPVKEDKDAKRQGE